MLTRWAVHIFVSAVAVDILYMGGCFSKLGESFSHLTSVEIMKREYYVPNLVQ